MELGDRFWDKVDASGDCWEWIGGIRGGDNGSGGYGSFRLGGRTRYAHRLVWESLVGPIPDGLQIDHLCRNRRCVNPDHLEPVTSGENIRRGVSHWRNKRECPRGHPYDKENTYIFPNGHRHCRTCNTERARAKHALSTLAGDAEA